MVDPETDSFLLLYDDAQSLYGKQKRSAFTFAEVGIQTRGRSTILRLNYRNTTEVLAVAYEFAREAMTPRESQEDDGIPILSPQSSGRHGRMPQLVQLSTRQDEALYIVRQLREFHASGVTWKDMAVLYRAKFMGERIVAELGRARIPAELQGQATTSRRYDSVSNSVKVLTMHSSKGLEFPVTIVAGVGYMPLEQEEFADEARLLYVAMTRAVDKLIITCHKESIFTSQNRRCATACRLNDGALANQFGSVSTRGFIRHRPERSGVPNNRPRASISARRPTPQHACQAETRSARRVGALRRKKRRLTHPTCGPGAAP